jgi:hypothetical protein
MLFIVSSLFEAPSGKIHWEEKVVEADNPEDAVYDAVRISRAYKPQLKESLGSYLTGIITDAPNCQTQSFPV